MKPFAFLAAALCLLALPAAAHAKGKPSKMLEFVKPEFGLPVTVSAGEAAKVLEKLKPEDREKLLKTGTVVSTNLSSGDEIKGLINAYIIAKQPKAKVWALLHEPSKQALYLPRLTKSKTVSKGDEEELGWFQVKVAFVTIENQVDHRWWPEVSRMAWGLHPAYDNDLIQQDGYYNLYAIDENTTLMELGTALETSALVPGFVQEYLTKKDLPDVIRAVKKYMDSDGVWRKD